MNNVCLATESYFALSYICMRLTYLFATAEAQGSAGQYVSQCSETMEQHSSELDGQNEREEEDKYKTNWLELQVLLSNVHLEYQRLLL